MFKQLNGATPAQLEVFARQGWEIVTAQYLPNPRNPYKPLLHVLLQHKRDQAIALDPPLTAVLREGQHHAFIPAPPQTIWAYTPTVTVAAGREPIPFEDCLNLAATDPAAAEEAGRRLGLPEAQMMQLYAVIAGKSAVLAQIQEKQHWGSPDGWRHSPQTHPTPYATK